MALRNLGLLIKTDWSGISFALLLRTLAVGRQKQPESIEVALFMEQEGLMNRFNIWSVPLIVKYRITCLRVTLRELENVLSHF